MSDAINAEQIKTGEDKKSSPIFNTIKEVFEDYFGEDRVEVTSFEDTLQGIKVVIYFPQITIKNSLHHRHVIKDLYVVTRFNNEGKYAGEYSYYRATFSTAELRKNYIHSHVNCNVRSYFVLRNKKLVYIGQNYDASNLKISLPGGTGVCLGSGPIASTMEMLQSKFPKDKMPLYKSFLTTYCVEIDRNVRWESIEGGPYQRMDGLKTLSDSNNNSSRFSGYFINKVSGILISISNSGERFEANLCSLGKVILKRVNDTTNINFGEFKDSLNIVHRVPNLDASVLTLHTMQVLQEIGNEELSQALLGVPAITVDGFTCLKRLLSTNIPSVGTDGLLFAKEILTVESPFIFKGKKVQITIYPALIDFSASEINENTDSEIYDNLIVDPRFIQYLMVLAETLYSYPQTK